MLIMSPTEPTPIGMFSEGSVDLRKIAKKNQESRLDLFIDGEAEAVQSLAAHSRLHVHIRDCLCQPIGNHVR
jgi:hypothetical protein